MRGEKGLGRYYFYLLLTALVSLGVVFANHLIVFLVFWGFLGCFYIFLSVLAKRKDPSNSQEGLDHCGGHRCLHDIGDGYCLEADRLLAHGCDPYCFDNTDGGRGVSLFCRGGFCQSRRHAVSYLDS